jgi:predicted secreted hydrolase
MHSTPLRFLVRSAATIGCAALLLGISDIACRPTPKQFDIAKPGYVYSFPRDLAAHPTFQTEWWYYTGHLTDEQQREYGYELVFFRHAASPESPDDRSRWSTSQSYFSHFAITDVEGRRFLYREHAGRGGEAGTGSAESAYYRTSIDSWTAEGLGRFHHLQAESDGPSINLVLAPAKPMVIHGIGGVSRKGNGEANASHYCSATRMSAEGMLILDGKPLVVTGSGWFDREWSTSALEAEQAGWDWFSLQFDSGEELMLYLLRRKDGSIDSHSSGTYIAVDGTSRHLPVSEISIHATSTWTSPGSQAVYPARWRVSVPSEDAAFDIVPLLADQELRTSESTRITYWEGAVRAEGRMHAKTVTAKGYVELTGYAGEQPERK